MGFVKIIDYSEKKDICSKNLNSELAILNFTEIISKSKSKYLIFQTIKFTVYNDTEKLKYVMG
ncbi:hypothetical protein BpHYR1_018501 [Brachionus plicatilis]|uniref:Uncharacterized protein n=1 Tax=Brachionus plicatilis TaxID=10195 RepID=A0A3M7QZT5_BRAPC|nr:hypothetical protein BpHYR1_018501 [Brachionus plicatilis]